MNHQPGGRIEAVQSGIEVRRRGMVARLWVAALLAILGFLVVYPILILLLGALTESVSRSPALVPPACMPILEASPGATCAAASAAFLVAGCSAIFVAGLRSTAGAVVVVVLLFLSVLVGGADATRIVTALT